MDKMTSQEMMSALADGQLRGDDFARGVELACSDAQAREAWQNYHLIGEVLRSGERAAGVAPAGFMDRLSQRLAQEPALQMPAKTPELIAIKHLPTRGEATFDAQIVAAGPAANDGSFRWKLVAGFASLAAVTAIGWTVVGSMGGQLAGQPQLAGSPAQGEVAQTGTASGVMIRDARLDELLAAHRQFGGASALQTPAGFLRNATFEGPAR